jgi:hypothetical protein
MFIVGCHIFQDDAKKAEAPAGFRREGLTGRVDRSGQKVWPFSNAIYFALIYPPI